MRHIGFKAKEVMKLMFSLSVLVFIMESLVPFLVSRFGRIDFMVLIFSSMTTIIALGGVYINPNTGWKYLGFSILGTSILVTVLNLAFRLLEVHLDWRFGFLTTITRENDIWGILCWKIPYYILLLSVGVSLRVMIELYRRRRSLKLQGNPPLKQQKN